MSSRRSRRHLLMGQARVSPAYLLVLPVIAWPTWTYISTPHPISASRLVAIIAGISMPIMIMALVIVFKFWTQHKERKKYLISQGFVPAERERTRSIRDALRDGIGIQELSQAHGVSCWHRQTDNWEERFVQFFKGSGKTRRRMFAIVIPAASTTSPLYWYRTSRVSMLLPWRTDSLVGPTWFKKKWHASGHPAVSEVLFSEDFCRLIDDSPFGRHQLWTWRYDQLWLVAEGSLTAEGIQAAFDRVHEVAHAAGIKIDDAHSDWWTELLGPKDVVEPLNMEHPPPPRQ